MKAGKEAKLAPSSRIISEAFKEREKNFIKALERVVLTLSDDQISRQMLQDETSEKFIARRVQEVFRKIIFDDRENYIDKILQRLQAFETMYKEEQEEIIRYLGRDFLYSGSVTKTGPVQRISHVHLLLDAIRDLNGQLNQLEIENAEYSKKVCAVKGKKRVEYDPNSPAFMHIYYEVDITYLDENLKKIQNDNEIVKAQFKSFVKKTKKIIVLMKQKSQSAIELYTLKLSVILFI